MNKSVIALFVILSLTVGAFAEEKDNGLGLLHKDMLSQIVSLDDKEIVDIHGLNSEIDLIKNRVANRHEIEDDELYDFEMEMLRYFAFSSSSFASTKDCSLLSYEIVSVKLTIISFTDTILWRF